MLGKHCLYVDIITSYQVSAGLASSDIGVSTQDALTLTWFNHPG